MPLWIHNPVQDDVSMLSPAFACLHEPLQRSHTTQEAGCPELSSIIANGFHWRVLKLPKISQPSISDDWVDMHAMKKTMGQRHQFDHGSDGSHELFMRIRI